MSSFFRRYLSIASGTTTANTSSRETSTKFGNVTDNLSVNIEHSCRQRVREESSSDSIGQLPGRRLECIERKVERSLDEKEAVLGSTDSETH